MVGKSVDVFRLKIDGRWLIITKDFLARHPRGSIITQYRYVYCIVNLHI